MEKKLFSYNGWYEDLVPYLKNPELTSPDYDWDKDIAAGAKEAVSLGDKVVALPAFVDPWILFYRKDILPAPPRTLDEMEAVAKKQHNPPQMYGFVARGLKNANAPAWDWVLFSFGGDFIGKDGKSALTSPEAVKAMDYYVGMLRKYGPPGVINFNWSEASAVFLQGQAALYFDGVNFAGQFEDETKSKVKGKVGYAVLPAGPGQKGPVSPTFSTGFSVSSKSKNKQAAYYFVQWATSKDVQKKFHLGGGGGMRESVWNDPEVKAKAKMPPEWSQAYLESLKVGRLGLPYIAQVTEYRDIIGVAIQKAIQGAEARAVLEDAHKDFQKLLDGEPK